MIFALKNRALPFGLHQGEVSALHLATQLELRRYQGIVEDYLTPDLKALQSADRKLWYLLYGEDVEDLNNQEWQACSTAARLEVSRFENWPRAYWTKGNLDIYHAMNLTDDIYRGKRR